MKQYYSDLYPALDELLSPFFHEDMAELYPEAKGDIHEEARLAVERAMRNPGTVSDDIRRARGELLSVLRQPLGEKELREFADGIGCDAIDYSPYRPWLTSVLRQMDAFLGDGPSEVPHETGEQKELIRNLRRAGMRRASVQVVERENPETGGKEKVWLCEAICPNCGRAVTLYIPAKAWVFEGHKTRRQVCEHCNKPMQIEYQWDLNDKPQVTKLVAG